MLHPVLETLFFLKVARNNICESIKNSNVKEKQELTDYIQNEASDYEVMHLITLGEMPENKFDAVAEQEVWDIFKESIIMNTDQLREDVSQEDIMTVIYEMGPVSEMGYSSAAPILEFSRATGMLSNSALLEFSPESGTELGSKYWGKFKNFAKKTDERLQAQTKPKPKPSPVKAAGIKTMNVIKNNPKTTAAVGVGLAAVAAWAGIKKMRQLIKDRKAAKSEKEKAALDVKIAATKKKIKDKKATA